MPGMRIHRGSGFATARLPVDRRAVRAVARSHGCAGPRRAALRVAIQGAALQLHDYLSTDARFVLSRDRTDALALAGLRYASRSKVRHVFDADFGRGILAVPHLGSRRV